MDEYYNVKRLAMVLSIQAEIEGMKAENMLREINNTPPAYIFKDFQFLSSKLNDLAYTHNEQL